MSLSETTRDGMLDGRLFIRQPARGYRAAIDPVLLAASVEARPGQRILDAGAGVGAAALCLAARLPDISVAGLEIRHELVGLARLNADENGFGDRVTFEASDVFGKPFPVEPESFDHVMINPPYFRADRANRGGHPDKASANVEPEYRLKHWLDFARRAVRRRGTVTVIFSTDRLDELMSAFREGWGGIGLFPLWPGDEGKPAKRVIVQGVKGSAAACVLYRGMVLHTRSGGYTEEAEAVLRHAAPLRIAPGER